MKASPDPSLAERLAKLIRSDGPIPVAHYMAVANAHYYATRDPLGAAGDFTTAPEVSQMFGELVGLWLADLWTRAGRPVNACYVELGPGRGTLAADALRAMRAAGLEPPVHFVETSPVLRDAQASRVPVARWHDDISTLPEGVPLLIVANEFFDALPIRQLLATETGWRELMVAYDGGRFVRVPGSPSASPGLHAEPGAIVETSPASVAVMADLARTLKIQGGAALVVDYGPHQPAAGETLQAVEKHVYSDPWENPGERDLTAHVDFHALGEAARRQGVHVSALTTQGEWLREMGIEARSAALAKAAPERAHEIAAARARLVAHDQMGTLFKVMAIVAPGWPEPAGFA